MPTDSSGIVDATKSNSATKRSRMQQPSGGRAHPLSLIRISAWRFSRWWDFSFLGWKRENKAWWGIGCHILGKIHCAAQHVQAQWASSKHNSFPAEAAFSTLHTGADTSFAVAYFRYGTVKSIVVHVLPLWNRSFHACPTQSENAVQNHR
ncbi:hypothetical protein FI667_g17097, partial [Globisporangium splendens]